MDKLPIYSRLHALAHLDDESFQIACSSNEELQMICDGLYKPGHQKFFNQLTDYLYMIRSQALFDNSLLKFQEGLTWKEFYDRLTYLYNNIKSSRIVNAMAEKGKLMELKILFSIGKTPNQNGANEAAGNDKVEVLKWMKENNLTLPDQSGADWAAHHGRITVLQWMQEADLPLPNQEGANLAALDKHLEVLKWMKENDLPLPDQDGANYAALNGHVTVLKWMKDNNLLLPNQSGANSAASNGHLEVLKWMKENGLPLPTSYGANYAARYDYNEVVQWLASQNPPILPN